MWQEYTENNKFAAAIDACGKPAITSLSSKHHHEVCTIVLCPCDTHSKYSGESGDFKVQMRTPSKTYQDGKMSSSAHVIPTRYP